MSEQILIAVIGGAATVIAALAGAIGKYRENPQPERRITRFEVLLVGAAGLAAGALIGVTALREFADSYQLGLTGVALTWDRSSTPPKTVAQEDRLKITVRRDRSVEGESTADAQIASSALKPATWNVNGYLVGDLLALSYGTRTSHTGGVGSYFLARTGDDYVGYTLVRDKGETVWCPYGAQVSLPAGAPRRSADEWKKLYPKLFGQQCRHVPLNPDRVPSL